MNELDALQGVLAVEHAVVYAYGVVASQTIGDQRRAAQNALDVHRVRRDRLRGLVVAADGSPVEASAAYRFPTEIRTPQAATKLAADSEREVALALGALVESGSRADREFAATALQDAAVRETYWRGKAPVLPGLPASVEPTAGPTP